MSWIKYKLTVLFFIAAVAAGVSVTLSEFNRMVYPAGPVGSFSLKGGGSDIYHLEFLGEKIRVELPVSFVTSLFTKETVESGKGHAAEAFKNLTRDGGPVVEELLYRLKDAGGKMASDIDSRVSEIRKAVPFKEWLPAGRAEER